MAVAAPVAEILPPLGHEPFPPMTVPVLFFDDGRAYVPHAFRTGTFALHPVCEGIGVAWTPVVEIDRVLLCIAGGNPRRPTDEMVVATLSRDGLRGLIADLQSIEEQFARADAFGVPA